MPNVGNNAEEIRIAPPEPMTVGKSLDSRIKRAREYVEELCILKAKADTLGILDYPQEFLEKFTYGPF